MLNRLARQWLPEFEALCDLLAFSAVVHADETNWSINSVWAFLPETARITVFGCHKDDQLHDAIYDCTANRFCNTSAPAHDVEKDFYNLTHEILRLLRLRYQVPLSLSLRTCLRAFSPDF
jgi:hypothetical protein